MKNIVKNLMALLPVACMALASCSDMNGDGEGSFIYDGSKNPENTSYRNPAWEPSLAGGTVMKGASTYVAISPETQWSVGIPLACPSLYSYDAMKWQYNSQACFTYDSKDSDGEVVAGTATAWTSNPITSLSADFCKTVTGANDWMFYSTADGVGAASANSAQGPYTDMGEVNLGTTGSNPYFFVAGTNYYVCYDAPDGAYIQAMNIRRGNVPTTKGSSTKIAGSDFTDVCVFRKDASTYYLFGTVKNSAGQTEIRYGKSSKVTGPYLDRSGASISDGNSNGELLVGASEEFLNPCTPMRVLADEVGVPFIVFNATAAGKAEMPSGFARMPMFVYPIDMDDEGWATKTINPVTGWTSPRFVL